MNGSKKISEDCEKYRVNFVFNSTGTRFVKDGKTYHLEMKDLQATQAYKSGLSKFFGLPEYKLYDPIDRHRLSELELMHPRYNAFRCLECSNFEICIGCVDCGNCKKVQLVEKDEIYSLRKATKETKENKQ